MNMSMKRIYGKTLEVYMCILTSEGSKGVREVCRDLGLSTPSLAQYHINKLIDLNLIRIDLDGRYRVNDQESIEALNSFLLLRGMLIPRLVIYSALLIGLTISYLTLWPWRGDFRDLTVLFIGFISASAFIFEAVKQYRGLCFKKK
jgi:hypothetical protein